MEAVASALLWSLEGSVSLVSTGWAFARSHWHWWLVLTVFATVWTVTAPLRGLVGRLLLATGSFVYRWTEITKACLHRYRKYVRKPEMLERPWYSRWRMSAEALIGTPMVVLVARKEHLDGLGRLLYKWLDAQDAWWCVFLPDTLEATCWASAHYWEGLHVESARTGDRAGILVWTVWAVLTVSLYALSVCVLFMYETVEGMCQGWLGVLGVLSVVNFLFCGDEGLVIAEGVPLNRTVVAASVGVVLVGCASRLWHMFETDEPSPLDRVSERYREWQLAMEEQEQAGRLADTFWRVDGGAGRAPAGAADAVRAANADRRALRESRALRRARWESVRAAEFAKAENAKEEARRGRRGVVGEDVPSENGPYRSSGIRPRSGSPGEQLFEAGPRMGQRGVRTDI
ncbi:hypothetical protein PF005_g25830 [Phytophthora fragariae]|uniref:Transmembrane protein n=1 Tax=Phytophthora fragariae TaxID=53985 RepID=A0A6A4B330_9STRA|nr:hypothetical protein PF003_g36498 [Phytophthora fragariae]KAE8920882.1 hypothetical protein PF009_g28829 [Phytophthora fragariae]KAE8976457.1 hypothetical protein PF011_g24047 [Phytophthora fragariae]KAE9059876.1 hypothetical protein PF010_g30444 [Phytophthora fragariae]KAE9065103.1 hypothetical protein PF006_g30536 [Phytophthora fragariae]